MAGKQIKNAIAERTKGPARDQIYGELPDRFCDVGQPTQQDQEPEFIHTAALRRSSLVCVARQIAEGEIHDETRQKIKEPGKWIPTLQERQRGCERRADASYQPSIQSVGKGLDMLF